MGPRASDRSGEAAPGGPAGERAPGGPPIQTFLIADVRGYTRFTQEQGDEGAASLASAFAGIAREAVEECGGELLELRGDEALAVFGSARQAIRAAVELQARFRDPERGFPLGVGIGLDAGEAVPVAEGFRGGALNLAARLCSIAAAGQILASETVTNLARHVEGVRLHERRAVRLKGLERPVRVHEIAPVAPLPPLPAAPRPKRRVPRRAAVLSLLGVLVGAASLGAYALTSGEPAGLPRLEENTVGLVDTNAARLVAQIPLGGPVDGIVADGASVWVSSGREGTVSRIDPETLVRHTIDVGGNPAGLAYGAGSVWVANSETREVAQIDSSTARVVQEIPVGNGPRAVAVGFGAVWVANSLDGTVSRIELERGEEVEAVPVGGTPVALAVSRDAVWVANESLGVLARIAGNSGEVVATIPVGSGPSAVAVGEAAVWVANRQDGTVSLIDPATNSVTAAVPVGPSPGALAVDSGGVWVAASGRGKLVRIAAASRRVESSVELRANPAGLALLDDGLWTAANSPLESHRGGTLRVESEELDSVDPAAAYSPDSWRVMSLVYDGLVGYRRAAGAVGGTLVANLATDVPTPTDGGRTYTFQLRPNLRYANGAPVRAADFRASVERFVKAHPFPPAPFVQGLVGGPACTKRPAACDLSRAIETDDEARAISIHLAAADPDFLYKLALPFFSLVAADSPLGLAEEEPLPGTGPYRLEVDEGGEVLRLVRNPHFRVWANDARPDGYPDEITIRIGAEADEQVAAVEEGRADWAEVPTDRVQELATSLPAQLHSDPILATYYMFLNVRVAPFDDRRVRRALNFATDRRRLVELRGGPLAAQPTCQLVPPNLFGYGPHCPYTVDPSPAGTWIAPDFARAARLVEASGTKGMKVTVRTFEGEEPVGRYFTSLLRQLGYVASLRVVDPEEYFTRLVGDSSAGVQIGATAWFADFPAASNFVAHLFSCDSFIPANPANVNYSGLCDQRVDAAIESARSAQALDPLAGGQLWAAADRALTEAAAAVPFANLRAVALVSQRVENYQYHPVWGVLLDQLWVQ